MVTNEQEEAVVSRAVALGIADYLIKPLKPNKAGERLARVLHSLRDPGGQGDADDGQVTLDERLAVLVAEGDSDYRHFLMDFFKPRCVALQASSGAQALAQCLRAAPRLVFVGGNLGIIDADNLVGRIRATTGLSQTRVIATVPRRLVADTTARGIYHGVVARSFVLEIFQDQFERLTGSSGPPVRSLEKLHPRFRMGLTSATAQVFGMALSTEIELAQEPVTTAGEILYATMQLIARDRQMTVEVTLQLQPAAAETLTRQMGGYDEGETVTDEDQKSTLGELVNMIVGRVQNFLAERGVPAELGLPKTGHHAAQADTGTARTVLTFETDNDLRFDIVAAAHDLS